FNLLYTPFPEAAKARYQAFVDGAAKPLGIGFAGLLILFASRFLSPGAIGTLAVFLAGAWLLAAMGLRKTYFETLLETLRGSDATLQSETLRALADKRDAAATAAISEAIRSPKPEVALLSMD